MRCQLFHDPRSILSGGGGGGGGGESNNSTAATAVETKPSSSEPKQGICVRCKQAGHLARGCAMRKLICYGCKTEGYTLRTCPNCSENAKDKQ